MKRYPLHWSVYVACAVTGSAAVAMLVIADITGAVVLGRWGIVAAMLAAVIATAIVIDRCAWKVRADLEQQLEAHTGRLVTAYGQRDDERTEEIAEAVCAAVLEVVVNRDEGPTPINPRD